MLVCELNGGIAVMAEEVVLATELDARHVKLLYVAIVSQARDELFTFLRGHSTGTNGGICAVRFRNLRFSVSPLGMR